MATWSAALGLLLLGAVGALPQQRGLCRPDFYHDETAGSCCYRCPEGQVPQKPCPQGLKDCRKECDPDYYVEDDQSSRCLACVSCLESDLVEKFPCTWNSPRICQCQEGMYCTTAAVYSCARCKKHSLCPQGERVKLQGTSEENTVCEPCPPGTFSTHSSSNKDCQPHTRCTTQILQMGNATHDYVCADLDLSTPLPEAVVKQQMISPTVRIPYTTHHPSTETDPSVWSSTRSPDTRNPSNSIVNTSDMSSTNDPATISPVFTGRPNPGSESLFWVLTVFAVIFGFVLFLICQQKACREGILQKFHLFPGQTFQPKVLATGYSPGKSCKPRSHLRSTQLRPEKQKLVSCHPTQETNKHSSSFSKEAVAPDLNATGNLSSGDSSEPRMTTEHTSNQIENIYIMKADTVIVGSVARVSEGSNHAKTLSHEEKALETDQLTHYPEQETELSPGGQIEVMFSVEEEGKEYHWPTTASAK